MENSCHLITGCHAFPTKGNLTNFLQGKPLPWFQNVLCKPKRPPSCSWGLHLLPIYMGCINHTVTDKRIVDPMCPTSVPSQLAPVWSRAKPRWHSQLKLPGVFWQTPLDPQRLTSVAHSLLSERKISGEVSWFAQFLFILKMTTKQPLLWKALISEYRLIIGLSDSNHGKQGKCTGFITSMVWEDIFIGSLQWQQHRPDICHIFEAHSMHV